MSILLRTRPVAISPRCSTPLDEGPVVYRCATCRRAVPAADLRTEREMPALIIDCSHFHSPASAGCPHCAPARKAA